jgi:hypothetical protein
VTVAEIGTTELVAERLDIAFYDALAQPEFDHDDISVLIDHPSARRVLLVQF